MVAERGNLNEFLLLIKTPLRRSGGDSGTASGDGRRTTADAAAGGHTHPRTRHLAACARGFESGSTARHAGAHAGDQRR